MDVIEWLRTDAGRDLVTRMRQHAVRAGSMHAWWDDIFEMEAHRDGGLTLFSPETLLESVKGYADKVGITLPQLESSEKKTER